MPSPQQTRKLIAENRRARFEYFVEETFEAGICLLGTEVKALRQGKANIAESYASPERGGLWLINANIPEYTAANRFNHEPKRKRQLLLHKRELNKLESAVRREGRTVIPLELFFNERGRAKLLIGLAKGKKLGDKRDTEKKRDWQREQGRLMRDKG